MYVAGDEGYVDNKECGQLIDAFKKLSIMINNFMEYLKGSHYKGPKYKMPKQKSMKEEMDELMKEMKLK